MMTDIDGLQFILIYVYRFDWQDYEVIDMFSHLFHDTLKS